MSKTASFSVTLSVEESGRKAPQYNLETDLNGDVTLSSLLKFTKSALIITADEILKEEQAKGFEKNPVLVVDNSQRKSIENVHPLGKIEFIAKASMVDVLLETYTGILNRSPVLTGRYKSSHFVFWNGTQVATDLPSLTSWLNSNPLFGDKDLIRFVNVQPYGRKLERLGVTAGRTKSRSVSNKSKKTGIVRTRVLQPNGAYFLTARAIRAKYKNNSVIKFTFISGSDLGITGSFKQSRKGKPGRPYLYPTIVISVQQGGTV